MKESYQFFDFLKGKQVMLNGQRVAGITESLRQTRKKNETTFSETTLGLNLSQIFSRIFAKDFRNFMDFIENWKNTSGVQNYLLHH